MLDVIETADDNWIKFVEKNSASTIFHHPSWSNLLADCYGYRPFILSLKDRDGEITAGLPVLEIDSWLTGRRWVSLPFTDHCSPLWQNKDDLDQFIRQLIYRREKSKSMDLEIRHEIPLLCNDIDKSPFYIHYLKLDANPEELFKRFRKKGVQYCIRKASKSGIVVYHNSNLQSMMTFYSLHLMTRKKLGVPSQPKKYFKKLWEYIIKNGMGFIKIAYYKDKAIAGGVFLHYNGKLIYKYGATDPDYIDLYSNHALLWETIKWACENGVDLFDWGRTDKDHHGLRHFKLGWGTDEKELCYSYIGRKPETYSTGWKKKIIENTIKKSPVWVGRALGELLYKHVG